MDGFRMHHFKIVLLAGNKTKIIPYIVSFAVEHISESHKGEFQRLQTALEAC